MSRFNKKKKVLQGMEHLQKEVQPDESQQEDPSIEKEEGKDIKGMQSDSVIKKELIQSGILISVMVLIIAGLFYLDSTTDYLAKISEKIVGLVL